MRGSRRDEGAPPPPGGGVWRRKGVISLYGIICVLDTDVYEREGWKLGRVVDLFNGGRGRTDRPTATPDGDSLERDAAPILRPALNAGAGGPCDARFVDVLADGGVRFVAVIDDE